MSALPKMDVPKYEAVLPGLNQKIQYRPFIVKEEKALLIAMQENDTEHMVFTIKNLIDACTFGKLKVDDLSQIDVEYLFLMIRNKSLGEGADVVSECTSCGESNTMTLDLSKVKVEYPTVKIDPMVQLADNMWVNLSFPTMASNYELKGDNEYKDVMSVLAKCVVSIIHGDTLYDCKEKTVAELVDWLENLTKAQFKKIDDFFGSMPKLVFIDSYVCGKCSAKNDIKIEGIENFLD